MAGKPWSRDEALVAFNVYCRLPFGKLHARNPEIQRIAALLGRSPDSLAMKCCNFASLDPAQRERGVSGLQKVASVDRAVWEQFESDPEMVTFESETALANLLGHRLDEPGATELEEPLPSRKAVRAESRWEDIAGLDRDAVVRVRVNQRFFRSMILASYNTACAVCDLPIPQLLVASHIVPWSMDKALRMNPCNGICLCALHDRAFDAGLMLIDTACTVRVSALDEPARSHPAVASVLLTYEGRTIRSPERWRPAVELLGRRLLSGSGGFIRPSVS
jgi:putative restriction endonuclease